MSKRIFPIDLESVADYGVENWRRECFWPVSQQTFIAIERAADQLIKTTYQKYHQTLPGHALSICIKLRVTYSDLIHGLLVLKRLQKKNITVRYHPRSQLYGPLLTSQTTAELESRLKPRFSLSQRSAHSENRGRIRQKIRTFRRELKLNSGIKIPRNSREVFMSPRLNRMGYEYAKKLDHWVHHIDPEQIISQYPVDLSANQVERIHALAHGLIGGLSTIANQFEITLNSPIQAWIHDLTNKTLIAAAQDFLAAQQYFENHGPNVHMLTSSGGEYFNRALGRATAANGGTVTAFAHGTPSGIRDTAFEVDIEFSHCHRFGIYSKNEGYYYQKSLEKYGTRHLSNHVDFFPVPTSYYENFAEKYQRQLPPEKIKTVMIMGAPFEGDSRFSFEHVDIMHLESELRIMETISAAGYNVIYKQHPDGVLTQEAYKYIGKNVTIIRDPFESVIDRADAFLFYYLCTSTLGPALCTNKPILLIQSECDLRWYDTPWALFEKRCRIIKSHLDDRHRLIFNREELIQTLNEKPPPPDHEFIENYFFT